MRNTTQIYECRSLKERERVLPVCMKVWEDSVRATHDFLDESEICAPQPVVSQAILTVPRMLLAFNPAIHVPGSNIPKLQGFLGLDNKKIEMLFVRKEFLGQGVGRSLFFMR